MYRISYQKCKVLYCVEQDEIVHIQLGNLHIAKFHPVPLNTGLYIFDITFCMYFPIKCPLFHFCCNLFKVTPTIAIDCLDYGK